MQNNQTNKRNKTSRTSSFKKEWTTNEKKMFICRYFSLYLVYISISLYISWECPKTATLKWNEMKIWTPVEEEKE